MQLDLVATDPSGKGVLSASIEPDLRHHWRQCVGDHVWSCPTWEELLCGLPWSGTMSGMLQGLVAPYFVTHLRFHVRVSHHVSGTVRSPVGVDAVWKPEPKRDVVHQNVGCCLSRVIGGWEAFNPLGGCAGHG